MNYCKPESSQYRLGLTLAFGSLLLTGTYNALAKGLTPFLSPMSLLIVSEALTGFFIVMTFGLVPLLKELTKLDWATIRKCIIVGLLNSAVAPLLWFTGLARTSAVNASMLSSADILCIMLFGYFLLKEKVSRMRLTGAAIVGAAILFLNVFSVHESFSVHIGDLFILSGAVVFGLGNIFFKKYLSHVMPELAIALRNVTGIVTVFILSLIMGHAFVAEVVAFPLKKIAVLIAFAFFSRYLDLTFFYEALDRLPATTLSMIMIANPLSGILFAVLILGESVQSYQLLGGIFIVFGLLLEQCSVHTIESIHHRWLFFRLPFRKRQAAPIPMFVNQV